MARVCCQNCQFWRGYLSVSPTGQRGECEAALDNRPEGVNDLPASQQMAVFVSGGDDAHARGFLSTNGSFYCAMFQEKSRETPDPL